MHVSSPTTVPRWALGAALVVGLALAGCGGDPAGTAAAESMAATTPTATTPAATTPAATTPAATTPAEEKAGPYGRPECVTLLKSTTAAINAVGAATSDRGRGAAWARAAATVRKEAQAVGAGVAIVGKDLAATMEAAGRAARSGDPQADLAATRKVLTAATALAEECGATG